MNSETEDVSDSDGVPPETLPFWFSFSLEETLGAEFEFSTIAACDMYKTAFEQPSKFSIQIKTQHGKKKTRKSKQTDLAKLCLNLDRRLFLVNTLQESTKQH